MTLKPTEYPDSMVVDTYLPSVSDAARVFLTCWPLGSRPVR